MKRIGIVGTLAVLVLCTGMALGQIDGGNLAGTVKDATGAAIPSATVTITSESTHIATTVMSNRVGQYRLDNMLSADYDIKVAAPGFQAYLLRGVTILPAKTSTEDVTLGAATSTSVEVEANAGVALDTTTNNLTTTFSEQTLNVLPVASVGYGVLNASLLAPNVASPGGALGAGVGPSVGGQRPRNNNYTIEGIDDNDTDLTGPLLAIPNDAVADFTLITDQFSPEFGHSSGGQFNVNVISGTNHVHGKLYEYFDNRNLNAVNAPAGQKVPNPRFDFNRYGGQAGGPIVQDKLFFFINFERSTNGTSESYFLCTPTAAGIAALNADAATDGFRPINLSEFVAVAPAANVNGGAQVTAANDNACFNQGSGGQYLTVGNAAYFTNAPGAVSQNIPLGNSHLSPPVYTNTDQITGSADYTLSPRDSFRFRYSYFTEGAVETAPALPAFSGMIPEKEHFLAFSYFHDFTPNLINEARIGFNRNFLNFPVAGPTFPGLGAFPNLNFYDDYIASSSGFGPAINAPQYRYQNLYELVDNVTYIKGRHTWKFGFDGRKYIAPQDFTQLQRGNYVWYELGEYLDDLAPDVLGERSVAIQNYYGDQTAFYGYGNDIWRATGKLTFNYGLRYEFTSVPVGERTQQLNALASVPGLISFQAPQPQYTNFAPRLGVAYAPDARTSVRAGFGIAYDVLFDNLGTLTLPPEYSQTYDVGGTAPGDAGYLSPNFLANGGLPNTIVPITSAAVARAVTAAYVPNQILPYSENYNLTLQRVFARNYTAEIQYLGTRGIHLITQNQLDITPPVTAANQLETFTTLPLLTDSSSGFQYSLAAGNGSNLAAIETQSGGGNYVTPAFSSAGFQSKMTSYQPFGASNYNGLGLNITRRFINGFQMNASYTFSKAMDDSTGETYASDLTQRRPQNSRDQHAEYALSALSRKHRLTLEAVYDVPYFKHSNFLLRNLLGNWLISPIYTYESPEFVTPSSEVNSNLNGDDGNVSRTVYNAHGVKGTGSGIVPVFKAAPSSGCVVALSYFEENSGTQAACYANVVGWEAEVPNAQYTTAGLGIVPDAHRNTLPGRPIDNIDVAAGKRISFTERYALEVQAQAFNLFNHAQYVPGYLDRIDPSPSDGTAYNYLDPSSPVFNEPQKLFTASARSMQLTAKFIF